MATKIQQQVQSSYAVPGEHYDSIRLKEPRGLLLSNFDIELVRGMIKDIPRDGVVLEAGAGTGRFTLPMVEAGFRPIATDINESLLATLRGRLESEHLADRCVVQNESIFELSFPDAYFDFIYSFHVIPRFLGFEDQQKAIHELARVLKPGGRLLFNYSNRNSLLGRLANRYVTPRIQMEKTLEDAGLRVVQQRGKRFISRGVLNRLPLFVGKLLASMEKPMSQIAPRRAWDIFILAEKQPTT